jgi:hypothetical protein
MTMIFYFKAIMFLYGFIFGSIIVYLICAEEAVLPGTSILSVLESTPPPSQNISEGFFWGEKYLKGKR